MTSITQNPTVASRIPEPVSQGITFERFIREIFEPYNLKKVGRRFREAQSQLECFVKDKHSHFQEQMAGMATKWMEQVNTSLDNR